MIVIDASAMVAIALKEEGYEPLSRALAEAGEVVASPINLWEAAVVVGRALGAADSALFATWLGAMNIQPAAEVSWREAREAFWRFGKGRHPAKLNMGDCFAYALARSLDVSLLYKGNDFALTDIRSAV